MPAAMQALGIAAVKAVLCIVGITAGGRMFIRPLYKKISQLANAEIFAATTLLVVLGTSFMTQLAGGCMEQQWASHTCVDCHSNAFCMLSLHDCECGPFHVHVGPE
jgi:hypothetical protein